MYTHKSQSYFQRRMPAAFGEAFSLHCEVTAWMTDVKARRFIINRIFRGTWDTFTRIRLAALGTRTASNLTVAKNALMRVGAELEGLYASGQLPTKRFLRARETIEGLLVTIDRFKITPVDSWSEIDPPTAEESDADNDSDWQLRAMKRRALAVDRLDTLEEQPRRGEAVTDGVDAVGRSSPLLR
jgi:hypothetical protein